MTSRHLKRRIFSPLANDGKTDDDEEETLLSGLTIELAHDAFPIPSLEKFVRPNSK